MTLYVLYCHWSPSTGPGFSFVAFSLQERNAVHSELLQLDLPNLVDPGEAEAEKLKQVTARYMYIKTKGATEIQI